MLPRFGELEIGAISGEQGTWRMGFALTRIGPMEGGHFTTMGLAGPGMPTTVPNHRHDVELDVTRFEWSVFRRLGERWDLWVRVPYDVKERRARVELVDPATPAEIAQMQANLEAHHGTRRLSGIADPSVLFTWKGGDVLGEDTGFAVAFGTSVPLGETEEDPFVAGDLGLPHEHVQFGTGTFDPLLEVHYVDFLDERSSIAASLQGRVSVYENGEGFQGPPEAVLAVRYARNVAEGWDVRAGVSFEHQGTAHWDGVRDVNTGTWSISTVLGASRRISDDVTLNLDARIPVHQDVLTDVGDTFEPAPTVQLGLSWSL
jgi:hypothetical protein